MLKDLLQKNRSYRRFHADQPVERQTLVALVDLARLVASARNLQPLRYYLSCEARTNDIIFPCLTWPVLGDWTQPTEAERPPAYILLLGDTTVHTAIGLDAGIAAQTILLGAVERGLGGCILGAVHHPPIRSGLHLPERYRILVVIALGRPSEVAVIEDGALEDPTAFWRDAQGVHHVGKRNLDEILLDG
jgi:nitroreductase